jgi:hypothetical protein
MDQRLAHNDNEIPLAFRKAREIGSALQDPAADELWQRIVDRSAMQQSLEGEARHSRA